MVKNLTFRDIGDWEPASISIVDVPANPMAVFEVYEDDEEFIKKYAPHGDDKMNNNNIDGEV